MLSGLEGVRFGGEGWRDGRARKDFVVVVGECVFVFSGMGGVVGGGEVLVFTSRGFYGYGGV